MAEDQTQPCPHCGEPYDQGEKDACPRCLRKPTLRMFPGGPRTTTPFVARGVEYATAHYVRAIALLLFGLVVGSALGAAAAIASASRNSGLGGFLGITAGAVFLGFFIRAAAVYGEANGHLGK